MSLVAKCNEQLQLLSATPVIPALELPYFVCGKTDTVISSAIEANHYANRLPRYFARVVVNPSAVEISALTSEKHHVRPEAHLSVLEQPPGGCMDVLVPAYVLAPM